MPPHHAYKESELRFQSKRLNGDQPHLTESKPCYCYLWEESPSSTLERQRFMTGSFDSRRDLSRLSFRTE